MARIQPSVVPLDRAFLDDFAGVWVERRSDAGLSREGARRAVHEGRLAEAVLSPHVTVLLAVLDGHIAGYAWTARQPVTTQLDTASLAIEDLYVVPGHRGGGVARALLTAAATLAHRQGLDQVTCSVPSTARDANRTLARMGFATAYTRRVAPTGPLLRRLRGAEAVVAVDQVLLQRRRRLLRAKADSGHPIAAHH